MTTLYFLSRENHDGQILEPRIPDNAMTRSGVENSTIPRICFSQNIAGALNAIGVTSENVDEVFYVHEPSTYEGLTIIESFLLVINDLVPDAELSEEVWVVGQNVKLTCIGKIKVTDVIEHPVIVSAGSIHNNECRWAWNKI